MNIVGYIVYDNVKNTTHVAGTLEKCQTYLRRYQDVFPDTSLAIYSVYVGATIGDFTVTWARKTKRGGVAWGGRLK